MPGPRRSSPALRSATPSSASAAWYPSTPSTNGSARGRSGSRIGSSGRDGRPLALAGLWAGWRDPATDTVRRTFTIITTTPNGALTDLHDRMPVVLSDGDWQRWLEPTSAVIRPSFAAFWPRTTTIDLDVYAVTRAVNDVRRDGPELIEPLVAAGV